MNSYDNFKFVVGILIVSGFLLTLFSLFFFPVPIENRMAVDIVLGTLGTMTVTIISYLFGSSRGSKEKDALIEKLKTNPENE